MASKQRSFRQTAYNPWERTETLPASEERIQVYRSRVAAKQSCFRGGDLKEDDRRAVHGLPNGPNGKPVPLPRLEDQVELDARTIVRTLPGILRVHRKRRGWTAKELAIRVGVSLRCIELYEAGKREPRYSTIKALAAAFSISVLQLFPDSV